MKINPQQLKKILLNAGLITEPKFNEFLEEAERSNQKIGDVLISKGILEEEELIKLEAYILGIPFINLEREIIDPEILKIIPEPIARSHNIVAFRKQNNNLEVAMLDPNDLATIEFLKKKEPKLRILTRLTDSKSIKHVLNQYQKTLEIEFGEIIKQEAKTIKSEEEKKIETKDDLSKKAEELPIVKIIDTLIKHAILQRASDIHIEPLENDIRIRYRIDGILYNVMTLPKTVYMGIVARIKVLSNLKLDETRLPQDGRFKFENESYRYSIRVSVLPVFDGEKIVMRLLPENVKSFILEELGLRGDALENIQNNLKKPVGMILVTGPTGSGKTSTLYTMMEILNTPAVNISTIEDPIEYRMPGINQTQINPKIGLTFANCLRSLVRQDPNIIMIGEIRDNETAELAVNAALTGHLVFSTVHTNNASGAIPRLIDMNVEPFLISSTLNVIIGQRLVRRLCPEKEKYTLTKSEIENLTKYCNLDQLLKIFKEDKLIEQKMNFEDIEFYRPRFTKKCPSGYLGRIGIFEVLPVTETIKELIVKKADSNQINSQAQKEGMRTMIEDGFIKAIQGITSIEEVLRVIVE